MSAPYDTMKLVVAAIIVGLIAIAILYAYGGISEKGYTIAYVVQSLTAGLFGK